MISRLLAAKITEAAKKMPVIAVTGPRQSGKSTLVQQTFPAYRYANLEDLEQRKFAREDPKGFLFKPEIFPIALRRIAGRQLSSLRW